MHAFLIADQQHTLVVYSDTDATQLELLALDDDRKVLKCVALFPCMAQRRKTGLGVDLQQAMQLGEQGGGNMFRRRQPRQVVGKAGHPSLSVNAWGSGQLQVDADSDHCCWCPPFAGEEFYQYAGAFVTQDQHVVRPFELYPEYAQFFQTACQRETRDQGQACWYRRSCWKAPQRRKREARTRPGEPASSPAPAAGSLLAGEQNMGATVVNWRRIHQHAVGRCALTGLLDVKVRCQRAKCLRDDVQVELNGSDWAGGGH